jgi:Holliday junction resolvase
MRRAARKDEIHNAVSNIFQQNGWHVLDLSRLGRGMPDLLAVRRAFCVLIEVKTPGWKSRLKPGTGEAQDGFRQRWKGCPLLVIESISQAWEEAEMLREVSPA